jgi:hypothetical protein
LEPLEDVNAESIVDIQEGPSQFFDFDFEPLSKIVKERRPFASPAMISEGDVSSVLHYDAITTQAYYWLWEDLQSTGWVGKMNPLVAGHA